MVVGSVPEEREEGHQFTSNVDEDGIHTCTIYNIIHKLYEKFMYCIKCERIVIIFGVCGLVCVGRGYIKGLKHTRAHTHTHTHAHTSLLTRKDEWCSSPQLNDVNETVEESQD